MRDEMKEIEATKSLSLSSIVETKAQLGLGFSDFISRKEKKRPRVVLTDSDSTDVRRTPLIENIEADDDDDNKTVFDLSNEDEDDDDDEEDFDGVFKLQKQTKPVVKRDANVKARMKHVTRVKSKIEQRPSYTEKQMLREKIKTMLFGAGWTIDYRPRRNRDYLDSVYISPSGSAYWSITKAYDALKKDEKDKSKSGGDFTPLPKEILCKLTRQTRRKIEKEIERNGKNQCVSRKSKRAKAKQDKAEQEKVRRKSTIHTSSNIGRLALLVRGSDDRGSLEDNELGSYLRKRTLLSWLIESGMVCVGEKVEYMNLRKTRVMQEGWITEDGIHCDCCKKIITVSRFELHAGSKLGQAFGNMFIGSGKSLMQCQIDGWNKQQESERKGFHAVDVDGDDPNDDTCGICGDGGDLICCDGCPSTFHLSCLDMQMLPQGEWHCPNCACKYCARVGRTERSLLTCRLCEKKYHKSCSPENDDMLIDAGDFSFPFCEHQCRELYNRLQKLLWVKHELDSGFSWSLIHRSDPLPDASSVSFSQRVESNSRLAIALAVMDECFLSINDSRSGISVIHNVVYNCGSNFSRLSYSGFLTAILEKGDEMICAASIRIHGTQLAEMPFIGTRHLYRRQGMCRRLLNAIESALSSLNVEKLIIPAIEEHLHTWTNAFGFRPLGKLQKREMRSINMLVFPGTDMLHKLLLNQGNEGVDVEDYSKSQELELKSAAKPNGDSSTGNPCEPEMRSSGKKSNELCVPNGLKGVALDVNEIAEGRGGADCGSNVEAIELPNGNGTTTTIGITDTVSTQVIENDFDSILVLNENVNDSNSLEPGFQFPEKESASVDARLEKRK